MPLTPRLLRLPHTAYKENRKRRKSWFFSVRYERNIIWTNKKRSKKEIRTFSILSVTKRAEIWPKLDIDVVDDHNYTDDGANADAGADVDMCPQILVRNMLAEWRQFERNREHSFALFLISIKNPNFFWKGQFLFCGASFSSLPLASKGRNLSAADNFF